MSLLEGRLFQLFPHSEMAASVQVWIRVTFLERIQIAVSWFQMPLQSALILGETHTAP
jgi:hypothetical protein